MPKPPMDPDSFDKVNFVIDAWTTGCDAPWYIFIETMKPAALKAFITLITFGWDDVLRGYLRPRGLRQRRTGKRKGKWARRVPRFPEIGELLGSNVPGANEVKGQRWSVLGKTLWRIDTVMQQAMFYWLVVDVLEDFVFDWTSLLYESYWCQDDSLGRFSYQATGYGVMPDGTWWTAGFNYEDYEEGPPYWLFTSGLTVSVWATVAVALKVRRKSPYDPPQSFTVRIKDVDSTKVFATSNVNDDLVDGAGDNLVVASIPPGIRFSVQVYMTGTNFCEFGAGVVIGNEAKE